MTRESMDPGEVRFFSGSSNLPLAEGIANHLSIPLEETHISRFSNDCLLMQLGASVRSRSVFIVQSLTPPVNDHLMELLMMLDIARSAAAQEIHAIIPYYSYARSDKKDAPRISITGRLVQYQSAVTVSSETSVASPRNMLLPAGRLRLMGVEVTTPPAVALMVPLIDTKVVSMAGMASNSKLWPVPR